MPTPVTFDIFSRILAGGFDEHAFVQLPTAGQRFFGRPETGAFTVFSPNANALDIEIIRANQRPAALVPRGGVGRFIGTTHVDGQMNQGTMFSRAYPLIEEEVNLGADQLNYRVVGSEGPYEGLGDADRLRILGRRSYLEMIRRIVRLQEYLAWQSLTLGKQSANAYGTPTASDYDWRRNSSNTVTPSHGWGNALGVPLTDLDAICDQLLFAGQLMPNFAIFGGTTMSYFLANAQVASNYANKLYFELLRFGLDERPGDGFQQFIDAGLVPYGRLKTPKGYELTIFTYPRVYALPSSGAMTKYFGDTLCLVGSTQARCDRYFGPNELLPMSQVEAAEIMERFGFNPATPILPMNINGANTVLPQMFYADAYKSNDRKHITMRMQGAPVFPTTMTDAFATLTVGTTS
jgi:hypothetical protein